MIHFEDFVPRMLVQPGIFNEGKHETFEAAVAAANRWIDSQNVEVVNIETVVLPNIWSRWEEGSQDPSLGIGDSGSRWHQFVRVWYRA